MFSYRNKKKASLNYPQHHLLSGAMMKHVLGVYTATLVA